MKRANPAAGGAPQWYYISDTQVRPVAEAQVLRAQAYILLYSRRAPQPPQTAASAPDPTASDPDPAAR